MKEDFKIYKSFLKKYNQTYSAFILLKALVTHIKTFELIIESQLKYVRNSLNALEKSNLIRKVDDKYIATVKGRDIFQDNNAIDKVIKHFNDLKQSQLGIKRYSACKADRTSINARLKEYSLEEVLGVIDVKFKMWAKDPEKKYLCTSMTTMMVGSTFEGYVDKIELFKNEFKSKRVNSRLDTNFE